jgi:hypothetical protein
MCGSETFAMLVSSNSMNVAMVTVIAMNQGLMAGAETGGADALGESEVDIAIRLKETDLVSRRPPIAGGCPILNTAIEADDGNPVLRARVARALRDWISRVEKVIAQGLKTGRIRPGTDPRTVATVIVSTLEGALMISRLENIPMRCTRRERICMGTLMPWYPEDARAFARRRRMPNAAVSGRNSCARPSSVE